MARHCRSLVSSARVTLYQPLCSCIEIEGAMSSHGLTCRWNSGCTGVLGAQSAVKTPPSLFQRVVNAYTCLASVHNVEASHTSI